MKKNIRNLITGTLAGAVLAAVPALGLAAPAFADVTAPSHAGVAHVVAYPHQLGASNAGGLMQPTLGNTNTAPQLGTGKSSRSKDDGGAIVERR
jgi:hypothetical protein